VKAILEVVADADRVFGYMDPPELRWLAETARALPPGAVWCEVGAWQGRSATAVAGGLAPGSRLILVDNFSGPTTRERPNVAACLKRLEASVAAMRRLAPRIQIAIMVGDSPLVAARIEPASLDVVFLDGDHAYNQVVADIRAWHPALKAGGLFCGHDITRPCGVAQAVREWFPHYAVVDGTSVWFARC
jgi:predicted O-methyltransferase YrrM